MFEWIKAIQWDEKGLIPVIIQSESTEVLTLAWINEQALKLSLKTGFVHLWSRSKSRIRKKGEVSGNTQQIVDLRLDCDQDALLMIVRPKGPACHTGEQTCFFRSERQTLTHAFPKLIDDSLVLLKDLEAIIQQRKVERPEGSYTTRLFEKGREKIYQKFGEEAVEVLVSQSKEHTIYEIADLIYHLMVVMAYEEITWSDVMAELAKRRTP